MPKTAEHPLTALFRAKLRDTSWKQFLAQKKALAGVVPQPWRWPDPKTGIEWTLMGRKADLVWNASPAHCIKNHTTTQHTVEEAIRHDEAWHESVPGKPDILMLWLATMREGRADTAAQSSIRRALHGHPMGRGVPGDGGYLDKIIGIVEGEMAALDAGRRRIIHDIARKWFNGNLLQTAPATSGNWRAVSSAPMPAQWPMETIERLFSLLCATREPGKTALWMAGDGGALSLILDQHPPSARMKQLLCEEALADIRAAQHGALVALERYHARGEHIDARVLEALNAQRNEPWVQQFPRLLAEAQDAHLRSQTNAPIPRERASVRNRL